MVLDDRPDRVDADPVLRFHFRQSIAPALAAYRVLLREDPDGAHARVQDLVAAQMAPALTAVGLLDRLGPSFGSLRSLTRRLVPRLFPASGFTVTWRRDDDEMLRFDITGCFYLRVLTHYGAPELTAVFCHGDRLLYGRMPRTLRFTRTATMADGATHCDFALTPSPTLNPSATAPRRHRSEG